MSEDIPGKKLKKLTGVKELSAAIEKLERKKEAMEKDFKKEAHTIFENLNPITILDKTLQNVKNSSSAKYSILKDALGLGSGYFSKRELMHQLKSALIKTFIGSENRNSLNLKTAANHQEETKNDDSTSGNRKENNYMNSSVAKVKAKPEVLPEPTYWPFFLALGIVFLGWGLLTTWLISLAGFIIMIISLTGWINILRHE